MDDLNVLSIHHLAIVLVRLGIGPLILRFGDLFVIHVTDRDDATKPRGVLGIITSPASAADQGNCRLFIGCACRRCGLSQFLQIPLRQRGRGDGGRRSFQEASSTGQHVVVS